MKIGIEAERANIANPTGVEHYAKQLILALAKIDPADQSHKSTNEYILYLRSAPAEWIIKLPKNFSYKVIPFPIFWTQLRISWEMLSHPVDRLFIMASALPLIHPKHSIVTIHDIAWDFYPETFSGIMLNYLKFSTWFACKFASNIIAVSEQTKHDLILKYNLEPEKVRVVLHGFDLAQEMAQKFTAEEIAVDKNKIKSLPEKFVIYVGTLQPRKNIIELIEAFIKLKTETQLPHSLVIVGGKGWLYNQIMAKIADHPEVIYLGYIHDRFAIIKKAELLALPSFYEGFGMTILDAFAMDVPVACSNISSMPEVAGDAAVYFDPDNVNEMAAALKTALTDLQLRSQLVQRGQARLKDFSWEKCARETLQILTR